MSLLLRLEIVTRTIPIDGLLLPRRLVNHMRHCRRAMPSPHVFHWLLAVAHGLLKLFEVQRVRIRPDAAPTLGAFGDGRRPLARHFGGDDLRVFVISLFELAWPGADDPAVVVHRVFR